MRKILFRGKRENTGEWVYGDLIWADYVPARAWISSPQDGTRLRKIDTGSKTADWRGIEVDPETVGQYTGLTDKNGQKIFEGDIVYCVSRFDHAKMVVVFEDGEFRMVLCEKYETYKTGSGFYVLRCCEKEIIGNVFDSGDLHDR